MPKEKIIFPSEDFMFKGLKLLSKGCKLLYKGLEHMFQALVQKIYNVGNKNLCSLTILVDYLETYL